MNITSPKPDEQDAAAWATLVWQGGVGPVGFSRLLARFGSAQAALGASEQDLGAPSLKLKPNMIASISAAAGNVQQVAKLITGLGSDGIEVICAFEDHYPPLLRQATNPPPVICVRGTLLPEDDPALAIIGTRRPTRDGAANAREIARACAERGVTIISGLALGVDTAAHRGALDAGGRTVAVLGSGLRRIYPPKNKRLAAHIARSGALISETPPSASTSAARLLGRNRLTAALSRGVVTVEATDDSGTMRTVRDAIALGLPLFACDWQADKPQADGTRTALAWGAEPILGPDAADFIVETIRTHRPSPPDQPALL